MQDYDDTGKIVLDSIYSQTDPRAYFSTLGQLDYVIPQHAKPVFANLLDAYQNARGVDDTKVIDLGCSYGINAALLKSDLSMQDLVAHYASPEANDLDRRELLELDRKMLARHGGDDHVQVVGLDVAAEALRYATEAQFIDDKVLGDFEHNDFSKEQAAKLSDCGLVISTGCVGYISEKTIQKVLDASPSQEPWMAHFVLRMFAFEPIAEMLSERGYVTAKGAQSVVQRRFASDVEKEQVLERLIDMGVDPSGRETEGWFHADLFVSRPAADIGLVSSLDLTAM